MLNCLPVRVATNCQLVLDRLLAASVASCDHSCGAPAVNLRIVVEERVDASDGELAFHSFGHDGLRFIRIAHSSFLAADCQTRLCISFVAMKLIEEEPLFGRYFFPSLISILDEMKDKV
jgi:hypothetical protein